MISSSFTLSPILDFKGDRTINVLSSPVFCPSPATHTSKLEPIEPVQLFPPFPSSEPIPMNEFKWMSLSEDISSDNDDTTDFSSSTSGWSSLSNLSDSSDSSDILQFKWSETP